jgi:steroid delta-isomerase-like uncharacterized protein
MCQVADHTFEFSLVIGSVFVDHELFGLRGNIHEDYGRVGLLRDSGVQRASVTSNTHSVPGRRYFFFPTKAADQNCEWITILLQVAPRNGQPCPGERPFQCYTSELSDASEHWLFPNVANTRLTAIGGNGMTRNRLLILTAALAVTILPAIAASTKGKAGSEHEDVIGPQWIAAWNSHRPDQMLALFTDDIVYEDVAFGAVNRGKAELRKFAAEEFEGVPDLELRLLRADIHGDHGTIEWTFSGTDKGVFKTGKKFSVRGVSVIDLRGGKISRNLDFYDAATIMRQVGVLPAQ